MVKRPVRTPAAPLAGAAPRPKAPEPAPATRLPGSEDLHHRVKLTTTHQNGALMMRPGRVYLVDDGVLEQLKDAKVLLSSERV